MSDLIKSAFGIPVIPAEDFDLPSWTTIHRLSMFRSALQLQGLDSSDSIVAELERIFLQDVQLAKAVEACKGSSLPQIAGMPWNWQIAVFATAQKIQLGEANRERFASLYPRMSEAFPYLRIQLVLDHCKRSPHAWLDGFAAKWDDDVWKLLRVPFGWECGCIVRPMLAEFVPAACELLPHGSGRVPKDVLNAAMGWKARYPSYLWNKTFKPKRPHVAPDVWKQVPAKMEMAEKARERLASYGISVTIEKND